MTNFVTGASARKNRQPPASALRIQNSVAGQPRAIGWGQARLAGNLIWYGDFQAVPQQSGGGKGGGGKGGGGRPRGGGSSKGVGGRPRASGGGGKGLGARGGGGMKKRGGKR